MPLAILDILERDARVLATKSWTGWSTFWTRSQPVSREASRNQPSGGASDSRGCVQSPRSGVKLLVMPF
jgi:hypothetical protein